MVEISLVVPTYNRANSLSTLISSIEAAGGYEELLVVDDRSTDNTRAIVEDSSATYVQGTGDGPTKARRIGAEKATGSVVGFLEDDHIVTDDFLDPINAAFENGEDIVQARVVQRDQGEERHDVEPERHIEYSWNFNNATKWQYGTRGKYIPFSLESGRFISKTVLEDVSIDDPYLKADGYGESISFAFRARELGYRIYFEPDSIIDHVATEQGGSKERFDKKKGGIECSDFDYHKYHNLTYIHTRFHPHLVLPAIGYQLLANAFGRTVFGQYNWNCCGFIAGGLLHGLLTGVLYHVSASSGSR